MSKNSAVSLSSAKNAEPNERPRVAQQRWGNKTDTSIHMGCSVMTTHRIIADPEEGFPEPSEVKGLRLYSFDEVDAWLHNRKRKATAKVTKETVLALTNATNND